MKAIPFSLGGNAADYDSKNSRANVINMIPEANNDGSFRAVISREGLDKKATLGSGPIRSNMVCNAGYVYCVSGTRLYRFDMAYNTTDLGDVGGAGRALIRTLGQPADNEICVFNGLGSIYTYTTAAGLNVVSDGDLNSAIFGDVLNERLWVSELDTNQFQASDVSDATAWTAATFVSKEENPDLGVACVTKKSTIWLMGEKTIEAWQGTTDTLLPIRKIQGATLERGVRARFSVDTAGEHTAWLADDGTVRMLTGSQMVKISDLDFDRKINGDQKNPGFTKTNDAVGMWIDDAKHKRYVLTFPTEDYTWVYDVSTGYSSEMKSEGMGRWRGNAVVACSDRILVGDYLTGVIYEMKDRTAVEQELILERELVSASVSFPIDVTIPKIEIDMETGVGDLSGQGVDPYMLVYYSKDGGETFTQASSVSLGKRGKYNTRVVLRNFGRLVRNNDFVLKLRVTDPVEVTFYGATMYVD